MERETYGNAKPMKEPKQRTIKQNASLHKLMTELADELNSSGMTMMRVLSHNAEIEWTATATKEYLLRPFIKAMYNKSSTTQLTTKELSDATEAMLRHVAKTTGVSLDFPSLESMQNQEQKERIWR